MKLSIIRSFWNFFSRSFTARVKIKKSSNTNLREITQTAKLPSRGSINQHVSSTHTPAFSCLKHVQGSRVTNGVSKMFVSENRQRMKRPMLSRCTLHIQKVLRSYFVWITENLGNLFLSFLQNLQEKLIP